MSSVRFLDRLIPSNTNRLINSVAHVVWTLSFQSGPQQSCFSLLMLSNYPIELIRWTTREWGSGGVRDLINLFKTRSLANFHVFCLNINTSFCSWPLSRLVVAVNEPLWWLLHFRLFYPAQPISSTGSSCRSHGFSSFSPSLRDFRPLGLSDTWTWTTFWGVTWYPSSSLDNGIESVLLNGQP